MEKDKAVVGMCWDLPSQTQTLVDSYLFLSSFNETMILSTGPVQTSNRALAQHVWGARFDAWCRRGHTNRNYNAYYGSYRIKTSKRKNFWGETVVGFELRTSCLLVWVLYHLSHALTHFCFGDFSDRVSCLCLGRPRLQSSLHFLPTWDERCALPCPVFISWDWGLMNFFALTGLQLWTSLLLPLE
jgi:hypothetical protein